MAWLLIFMQMCFFIDGVLIVGAQWLAAQEINNNTALINGYTLNIEGILHV